MAQSLARSQTFPQSIADSDYQLIDVSEDETAAA
jgi:hypothetical protein